ncbi:MAG: membrane protein, partial [Actinomycetota bacterium]|nr:membrane protein [Actinomycetota bacterium]
LSQVFGAGAGDATALPDQQANIPGQASPLPPATIGGAVNPGMRQAVADIADALNRLRQAQGAGDFTAQGKALADLDAATKRFDTAVAASAGEAASAPSGEPAPAGGG